MIILISSLLSFIAIGILYFLHFSHSTLGENVIFGVTLFVLVVLQAISFLRKENKLKKGSEKTTEELVRLDDAAKLLIRRDWELNSVNQKLDTKVDELKKGEESLREAYAEIEEEQLKTVAILSNLTDPIIVLDDHDCVKFFNNAARDILGLSFSDIKTKISNKNNFSLENFKRIIKKDFVFKIIEESKDSKGMEEEIELTNTNPNKTFKVITETVLDQKGENLGMMKIFYDLTREKMVDRMKSEFISVAAHQLRTPLSAIKWVIQMILDEDAGKLNQDQRKLLEKGFESNERMITLVNDLLDVSRIEEGQFNYNFREQCLLEIINGVVNKMAEEIRYRHLEVKIDAPKGLPKLRIDKEKIEIAIQNLLDNAVKYSLENGIINIKVSMEGENFVKVSIKDNGVGVPKESKHKLFTKFYRATNVVKLETDGTGLGLFITKNIIERHGGKIFIESEEGNGTEVVFTLMITNPANI